MCKCNTSQVDTCATLVPWSLVGGFPIVSLTWFHTHTLVVAATTAAAPFLCCVQGDKLMISSPPSSDVSPSASATVSHALTNNSRVSQGRWDDALELARVHPAAALDADVVHKAAWVAFVQSAATSTSAQLEQVLRMHVTNILDIRWSLDSIRHCVLDTPAACHRVWSFGLSTVVDGGHDVALLQLLDRLDTFLRLLWADECSVPATSSFELVVAMDTLADCFDVASFRQFLDRSWVDIAMALATAGRVSALTVRHLSSPM
ncbi:hypothetical protein B5M09_008249 [Aphanomyces astaci]|uniref:Uncharacterized protein n=1 Tax=Aphanomyces astaci TaxID=112090 RepID=A0A425C2P9_APHAT|nr:hypothetical protein B5M09_008249 [Aphanomyces astaci]